MLYLREVVEAEKLLSITLVHDGKTVEHDVKDSAIASFLKVNDLNTGYLLRRAVLTSRIASSFSATLPLALTANSSRTWEFNSSRLGSNLYSQMTMLPSSNLVTVVNYVANTRLHKLRLSPDPQGFPPSPSPPFSVDLGESDVRLASPRPTVCQTRSSPVPSRQKRRKVSCEKVPLKVEQGSPPNDAARLASNDSK